MGDKTIPDSAEPRLESFYPPFVAGIDLPHQGVVDSYNPTENYETWLIIHAIIVDIDLVKAATMDMSKYDNSVLVSRLLYHPVYVSNLPIQTGPDSNFLCLL